MPSDLLFPSVSKVYFEVCNTCNFNCDFCPINISRRPKGSMDLSLYRKGIDNIVNEGITKTIGYHILGEPLLYKQITAAVQYASEKGLRTELTTNGSLLTEDKANELIRAGLDKLTISLEAVDQEEHYCRGSHISFPEYYQKILKTAQLVSDSNSKLELELGLMNTFTHKYFEFNRNTSMKFDRGNYKTKLTSLITDIYRVCGLNVSSAQIRAVLRGISLNRPKYLRIHPKIIIYIQLLADWGNAFSRGKIYPAKLGYCGYALTNVGVLYNGDVTICCPDFDGKTALGNLNNHSLGQLLTSEKARLIKEGFQRLKIVHPYCRRCFGSTNPAKALFKGLLSIYLFKILKFQPSKPKEVALLLPRSKAYAKVVTNDLFNGFALTGGISWESRKSRPYGKKLFWQLLIVLKKMDSMH